MSEGSSTGNWHVIPGPLSHSIVSLSTRKSTLPFAMLFLAHFSPTPEEVIEEAPKTLQQRVDGARTFLTSTATGKGISIAAGLFLGATLLIAMYRTWQKYSSPRAQRMRVVSVLFLAEGRAGRQKGLGRGHGQCRKAMSMLSGEQGWAEQGLSMRLCDTGAMRG